MRKRFKTILFVLLLSLFAFIAPLTFLYSKGYQFDFSTKKFVQLGGLYFKVRPVDAEVTINDTLAKKTSIFFGTVLFENLLPKTYAVKIEKEGFFVWQKDLQVKEQIVTEAKNIVLIPLNPDFSAIASNTEDFWFSNNEKNLIYKNIGKKILSTADIADIENLKAKSSTSTEEELAALDVQIPKTIKTISLAQKLLSDSIIWLGKDGFLYSSSIDGKTSEKIDSKEFAIKPKATYRIEAADRSKIFLLENSALYYLNPEIKEFARISDYASSLIFSPDNKKVAFHGSYELWLYFIEKEPGQPQRQAGEKLLLMKFTEKIGNVFWLTSHYLVFNAGDKIKVSEIDNRDRINIVNLAGFDNPKIIFNQIDKKLYVLSSGNLYASASLLR